VAPAEISRLWRPRWLLLLGLEVLLLAAVVGFFTLRIRYDFSLSGPRPHVFILLVDALRADRLSCYGAGLPTSPTVDRLAAQGTLFEQGTAQAPWTKPSVVSLFTSLYGSAHRVNRFPPALEKDGPSRLTGEDVLPDSFTTLAEVLQSHGWQTLAYSANRWVDPLFGLAQGFDQFVALATSSPPSPAGAKVMVLNLPAEYLNHEFLKNPALAPDTAWPRFLSRLGFHRRPLFVYLHYMDVHGPYQPPPPFDTRFDADYARLPAEPLSASDIQAMHYLYQGVDDLRHYRSRYDGQIAYFNAQLERLLAELKRRGFLDHALLVFTADHGEALRDHQTFDHGTTLYQEEVRVPLIFQGEGVMPRRSSEPVRLMDVAPTILAYLGLPIPEDFEGRSLLPLLQGGTLPPAAAFSENHIHGRAEIMRRQGNRKVIYQVADQRIREIYDLALDPGEKSNRVDREDAQELAQQARALAAWQAAEQAKFPESGPLLEKEIDPALKKQLRALGYVDHK